MKPIVVFFALLFVFSFASCSNKSGKDLEQKKLDLRQKIDGTEIQIDKAISKLNGKLKILAGKDTLQAHNQIKELKEIRAKLNEKSDQIADVVNEEWEGFKAGTENVISEATKTILKTEKENKNNTPRPPVY